MSTFTKFNLEPSTPSERIVSNETTELENEVIDIDGKVYKLKVPDPVDEFDLSAALGKESTNLGLISQSMPLIYIESIDGEAFKKPNSYSEIRASLRKIGRNGMRAVSAAVYKFSAAENANQEANLAEIKK